MPVIRVDMLSGKPLEIKRDLVRRLTDAYVDVTGVPPHAVTILLNELEKSEWGVGGLLVADKASKQSGD